MIGHISSMAVLTSPISDSAVWVARSTGVRTPIRAVVSHDVEYFDGVVVQRRTEITYAKTHGIFERDEIEVRGQIWLVKEVIRDDGFLVRVSVISQRKEEKCK